jgi:hypothetical protein
MRALDAMVRRVIACRPATDDPGECGLGRSDAVAYAFRISRALFWSGLEDVRQESDERTLGDIERAVANHLRSEGATRAAVRDGFAHLIDERGVSRKTIGCADLRLPDRWATGADDGGGGGRVLDRTLGQGWRTRLLTTALVHRAILWKRRGIEGRIRDTKTTLVVRAISGRVPRDVLGIIVRLVRA